MQDPNVDRDLSIVILRADVDEIRKDLKDLLELWKAAGKVVAVVKWLSTLAIAVAGLWAVIGHWLERR